MRPEVTGFFDETTNTISYVLADPETKRCAIIDSVWDYDPDSGRTDTSSVDSLIGFVKEAGYEVELILETHAHADHLSASQHLKQEFGAPIAIGSHIREVQSIFKKVFNLPDHVVLEDCFDRLIEDHDVFSVGSLELRAIHTPGHTPACMAYICGDIAFIGDTLFMPDYGTARADFPGGDAETLYRSIQKLFELPDDTRLYLCHDYLPAEGRTEYQWETTVGEQRRSNIHVHDGISEQQFVKIRSNRDATLSLPTLIIPSVQVNIRAGSLPPPESNGVSYIKVPVNTL
ncbi:MBL fold metallo-hydrolase [Pseudohalioglobus lutimaris]|uniref:MBL fold metallo-hydrolase n=1 Tax=Pseudohalioglobus lutimaris TaxID=1737061 RepID=A0A2N5WZF9_9GAMM|nr:MBL fold metallo-hydrolase [Pseudohalioglobus lutimaris]PLW67634.1 MBL fold metallo-hydrolase [Pseudohalioglobus lutimaris]